ncbi:MAG TPA: anti-sigma factor, partial [Nitrospiraceae bacterium]|nr:anti-sigma factor [Nitrospiraceae bacterium]
EAVPLYAIGALDRQERQALEAHLLTGCAACRAALKEHQGVAALLPHGLSPVAVPPTLEAKVLGTVVPQLSRPDEKVSPTPVRWIDRMIPSRSSWQSWAFSPVLAFALALLLVGTGRYALSLRSQISLETAQRQQLETALQEETARLATLQHKTVEQEQLVASLREELRQRSEDLSGLQASLAEQEAELARVRTQLAQRDQNTATLRKAIVQRDELVPFMRSPQVKVITLHGSEMAKSAGALLLFDPDSKTAFLYAFNMPLLPAGKIYQLWVIVDKPISAGMFGTDTGHKSRLVIRRIPDLAQITKFAVSLEPEGGRPQPTGDIYLVGEL